MKKFILPLIAAPMLCSCISADNMSSREPVADREYQTGSNIPRRASNSSSTSSVSTMDRDAAERARDSQILPPVAPGGPKGP